MASLKDRLIKAPAKADDGFPTNEYPRIEGGEATLKRLRRKPEPAGLKRFEKLLKERMEPVGILEALSDTEEWLNWTRPLDPSRQRSKTGESYRAVSGDHVLLWVRFRADADIPLDPRV